MGTVFKLSGVAILCATVLSACGGGATACDACGLTPTPTPTPVPPGSVSLSTPGTLFGATGIPGQLSVKSKVKALPSGSGVAYYLPIINRGTSILTVSSAVPSNNSTGVWTTDVSDCQNVAAGSTCQLGVAFNANKVSDASQLNSLLTVTYSDGRSSPLPVSANVVARGSLNVQMPSTIVPDSNGYAYGVITVFNGTTDAQLIQSSTIAPTSQRDVTWTFSPNCDGVGGGTVQPLAACSIGYIYHVDPAVTVTAPEPISVSVPITNNNPLSSSFGQVQTAEPVASVTPPASTTNPLPYLVYNGGAVSVASGSGTFVLQNVGNAVLASISFSGLSPLTQTNTCTNVPANATCTVTLSGTNPPSSITVIPSAGNSGNIIVPVAGQALALSPSSYSFGSNYSGAIRTASFSISNLGATSLAGLAATLSNAGGGAYVLDSSACISSLSAFSSCNVIVTYTAPTAAGTQSGQLTASATGQTSLLATLSATSQVSNWSSAFTSRSAYTDVGAAILSLAADSSNNLYFGNSYAANVSGARNVWELNSGGVASNLTPGNFPGYIYSAPTALMYLSFGDYLVGYYNGTVQKCGSNSCSPSLITASENFGVTSVVKESAAFDLVTYVGLSDKTTGVAGQLWAVFESNTYPVRIPAITGAVGKMATDGTLVYAPVHNISSVGTLFAGSGGTMGTTNLAPSALVSNPGTGVYEYITVVFYAGGTLYAGTSMGNVYSSSLPVSTTSWTKLTVERLATQSSVGALGLDAAGNLYAGLTNLLSPTSGGGVYVRQNNVFTASTGYTDTSSVSSMLLVNGKLNVATYNGNIWQIQ